MSIFVSVAAFREPHLQFTLDSLFRNAYAPDEVFVGLVDQSFDPAERWLKHRPYSAQVRSRHVHPVQSQGVSWARALAQELYRGEHHYLQVDSHTWFAPGWDRTLLDLHANLLGYCQKPVLTAYPPGFEFDAAGEPVATPFPPGEVFRIVVESEKSALLDASATLTFKTELVPELDVMLGFHIAGGFAFADAAFIHEVPYDAHMYFHGEEQNLTLRAWTRGWDPVHIRNDWIPLRHLYKSAGTAYDSHHWDAALEAQRTVKWTERNNASHARLIALIRGELPGEWGLGNARSLQAFCEFSGIDYLRYLPR